ncbi:GmrSD restriction endonuclease domain-containing protein [Methylobacter luteus]|uniref:GmrSD restriction endonuclease domain-containing protein n=1 Tax=Methylobacter luteus TaxID=415 RepID=UPI0004090D11|nr:DUF262 domain-containing protein [Methylobacter luteus]
MMSAIQEINELSVSELFQHGHYTIPIYQRNYAWGESEVEQLLQDVMDFALNEHEHEQKSSSYYIGSLVTYQRDNDNFEIIDGQQRHTTLSIFLSVIKNEFDADLGDIQRINLGFDSRDKSDKTLRMLFNGTKRSNELQEEYTIRAAYDVTQRYLKRENANLKLFINYLLNKVKILRVVVPADTDLNHYFEIMNNRGEQLEKHEVLKARLMSQLSDNTGRSAFAKVWDACADMERYVQLGIPSDLRDKVFGSDWSSCPDGFNALCSSLSSNSEVQRPQSLAAIIAKPQFHASQKKNGNESLGTFSSVINFPNFLLHVLRVTAAKDIPLDDKRLLDIFSDEMLKSDRHAKEFAQQFILDLLRCRMLFDRYIIKRENDEDWSLKVLKLYESKQRSFSYVNSTDDEGLNQKLVMILSMFHVSFPTQAYKHWLNAALYYLYHTTDASLNVAGHNYLQFLESLSNKFFYGRFGTTEPLGYFDLIYRNPTLPSSFSTELLTYRNVQNFIFNRLDYQLWKRLNAGERFAGVNMDYVMKRLKGFSFTFRSSVEHYYPQNPLNSRPITESITLPKGVDTFGNLCLISHSNNSRLSNYLPTAKKEHYEKSTTIESLKQVFMMSYDNWGPEYLELIAEHEQMMIRVLCD